MNTLIGNCQGFLSYKEKTNTMEFRKRYKVVGLVKKIDTILAKKELKECNFDGVVEFTDLPIFSFDVDNLVKLSNFYDSKDMIEIREGDIMVVDENDNMIPLSKNLKNIQVNRIKLDRNFDLQDLFDKHKDAKCFIFMLSEFSKSIYHEGYTVRFAIINAEGIPVVYDDKTEK